MLHVSACQRLVGLLSEESLSTLNNPSTPNNLNALNTLNALNAFLLLKRLRKN